MFDPIHSSLSEGQTSHFCFKGGFDYFGDAFSNSPERKRKEVFLYVRLGANLLGRKASYITSS